MICKKIGEKFITILLMAFLCLGASGVAAFADEVEIGVTPSIINNIKVPLGGKVKTSFKVMNIARFPGYQASKKKLYAFKVNLASVDPNTGEGNVVLQKNINGFASFDVNDFVLEANEEKKVNVSIDIPDNVTPGEYVIGIRIRKIKIDEQGDSGANARIIQQLLVPVFVEVTDKNGISKVKSECRVNTITITSNMEVISMDAFTIKDNFLHKAYKLELFGHTFYDIPKISMTRLRNVICKYDKQPTVSKYIVIPKGLEDNSRLGQLAFEGKTMVLTSGNNTFKIDCKTEAIAKSIKQQAEDLASMLSIAPNFAWLLDNISMPSNLKNESIFFTASTYIKNIGTKTIIPVGIAEMYDSGNKKIDVQSFGSAVIRPGKDGKIEAKLMYDPLKYTATSYILRTAVMPYPGKTIMKDARFSLVPLRYIILIVVLIVAILLLLLVFVLIRKTIKRIICKRKQKRTKSDNQNIKVSGKDDEDKKNGNETATTGVNGQGEPKIKDTQSKKRDKKKK